MGALDLSSLAEAITRAIAAWFAIDPGQVTLGLRTIAVGAVCNVFCAVLGCFLVLRRMSLLGDAISHAILPGLAIGFLLTGSTSLLPMLVGATLFGLLTALLTQTLHSYGRVTEDAGMGVVFTSLFALGVVIISNMGRVHIDQDCVFEGRIDLVAIDTFPLWGLQVPVALQALLPVLLLTLAFVGFFWKELKVTAFDPLLATAMGINATLMHYLLMGMVATATVAAFQAVGSILVVAMLIVPGATAHLLTDRLGRMVAGAALVAIVGAVFGYIGASLWNTSVAGMSAVAVGGQFAVAVLLAPRHGLVSKALGNARLAIRIAAEDLLAGLYRLEERTRETGSGPKIGWGEAVRLAGGGLPAWPALLWLRLRRRIAAATGTGLQLTPSGRQRGHSIIRAHRLWEAYLDRHFELPADHLHEPAERIEHYIGPGLQAELARELDDRRVDPHGRSIPASSSATGSRAESEGDGEADATESPG